MSRALVWIRKSDGAEDDIGLQMQRDQLPKAAADLADDYDVLDLGVQTGFSTLSRSDDGMLDDVAEVNDAVEELRAGAYDYLVAVDDRRICRDKYLSVIEHACVQGDCEMVYTSEDVEEDDLAFDIQRRVEQKTKEEEIRKSKAAVEERVARGYWQGRAPYGLEFDENGEYLVPSENYEDVLRVFDLLEAGETYREIEEAVGVSRGAISRMKERGREFYEVRAEAENPA